MNKLFLFFTFTIWVVSLKGQQQIINKIDNSGFISEIQISESNFKDSAKGKFTIRDYFEFTDPSRPGSYKLPSKIFIFAIPPFSKPKISVISKKRNTLINTIPEFNPIAVKKNDSTIILKEIDFNNYVNKTISTKKNDYEVMKYFWYRDFYCVAIKLYTHEFNQTDNSLRILNNIKLRFDFPQHFVFKPNSPISIHSKFDEKLKTLFANWQIAEQFRNVQITRNYKDSTDLWINFGKQYIKIGIANDNIYKINRDFFNLLNINTEMIDPRTFQLFSSGKEVEIYVKGEEDGTFDPSDYIEFWGQKNYNPDYRNINLPNEEYNEFTNRYTDTTYYFLTWGSEFGKRVKEQVDFNSNLTDTLDYYLQLDHYEDNTMLQNLYSNEVENQMPSWNRNKAWYWSWLFTSPKNFNFSVSDLIPNHQAAFYFKLVSGGSNISTNAHQIAMKLGQTVIDSQSINKQEQVILHGSFNSSLLNEGTNKINIKNYSNGTSPNFLAVDWYDVEYPRELKFNGDSLIFSIHTDVNPGEYIIEINNVHQNNFTIFKVYPTIKKINTYQVIGNNLFFSDTLKAGDKYCIAKNESITTPKSAQNKVFKDLLSSDFQADYLAITNSQFLDGALKYLQFIEKEYNIKTKLIDVQNIFDQFGFGYPNPEAIKLFLQSMMLSWSSPKPTYLVLIGDASYDYKDYIFKQVGVKLSTNYVPSFGTPVGDNWFVIWDEDIPIPQMEVGRIPINSEEQLDYYLSKHKNNIEKPYSEWNKRYLFFSGGNSYNSNELTLLKNANDNVINHYIKPKPIAGLFTHFYKTVDPQSEFGPYDQDKIEQEISSGGVFISYLGHSGTATWDNGINATFQLENTVDQNPLITDYGCSTNKFAEPDIISFGERFLLDKDGQAIGYIGNSSLGFLSTATNYPDLFYKEIISDTSHEIGSAHIKSKIALWQKLGGSSTTKIFEYTNCLLGDPIVRLKIPRLPNLLISKKDLIIPSNLTEQLDSAQIKIPIKNLGLATDDSVDISITQFYNSNIVKQTIDHIPIPEFSDTLSFYLITLKHAGQNLIKISIDPLNKIKEIYENDNNIEFQVNVLNLSLRDLNNYSDENGLIKNLVILNPTFYPKKNFNINIQFSDSKEFLNSQNFSIPADSFYTKFLVDLDLTSSRYWYRYKLDTENDYSLIKSFFTKNRSNFVISDTFSINHSNNTNLDLNNNFVTLSNDSINFSVLSAGWYAGATCVISKNGKNLLPNSFFPGIGIVIVDSLTYNIDTVGIYPLFGQPANVAALTTFINSIPTGKIVFMGVADDARNNMSSDLRNAIKTLGSSKIDSLQFRGSWALIGWKGADPDSVIEMLKGPYEGQVFIEKNYLTRNHTGTLLTSKIGPAAQWQKLTVSDSLPSDSKINYRILGIKDNSETDTLNYLTLNNGETDLSFLNPLDYKFIKVLAEFNASSDLVSPVLKSIGVSYKGVPELGTNYQVVAVDKDSVDQGENINLSFYVYNVGESAADSFKVKVDLIKPDNSSSMVYETIVDSLGSEKRKRFEIAFNTVDYKGEGQFNISIDADNKIVELYEDNNFYSIPFFVRGDTTKPSINITFDGEDIFEGEYISATPHIKIELDDPSLVPINDTSAVTIFLNDEQIYYSQNQNQLKVSFSNSNPKVVVNYSPTLEDGEYTLTVFGQDANGNIADSNGISKTFVVDNEAKMLNLYNYPNPFSSETYFTFKLTQIPEEINIKVYTITGRLVKKINLTGAELDYDFNKIYWDGRDEDGDLLANGVYIYKVIMYAKGKTQEVTQKLAIVR